MSNSHVPALEGDKIVTCAVLRASAVTIGEYDVIMTDDTQAWNFSVAAGAPLGGIYSGAVMDRDTDSGEDT